MSTPTHSTAGGRDDLAELEAKCDRLREAAHNAPFAEYSMDHRGHTAIVNHTNSWAIRGREWVEACRDRDMARAAGCTAGAGRSMSRQDAVGGSTLQWVQRRDGQHNGRPRYEYTAIQDGIKYHIVWAIGAGFGHSISFAEGGGRPPGAHYTISWCGTLKKCKSACEKFSETRAALKTVGGE